MINDKNIIGSIVGPHAGETLEEIFPRKNNDILKANKTIWLVNSSQVSPGIIKRFCLNEKNIYCYFLLSASNKQGNQTVKKYHARFYSNNFIDWEKINDNLSPISGKIDLMTTGIIINKIELINEELDFWDYIDYLDGLRSVLTFRGGSTFCAKKSNYKIQGSKSNIRTVIAKARLCEPYAVFLRR